MAVALTSKRYRVDDVDAGEFCFQQGWTDGLPVVPPTEDRVTMMLAAGHLDPKQEIAYITNRSVSVTAEKVAINAVMAGCRPEYIPVVVAAVQGIGDPAFGYHGPGTSTGGAAVLMIVNGPITRELDINSGDNLFGPGWRANLSIGRALRLVMRNVCGSLPGLLDRGTLGHPGKLSYVIAENEAESPWTPLHVERGFRPDQSAVTVMAAESPHQFYNQLSPDAEGVLTTIAGSGWGKKEVRQFLFENTQNTLAHLKRTHRIPGAIQPGDDTKLRPIVAEPDDILIVAAGGRAGSFSSFIPGWGGARSSLATTKEVKR